MHKEDPGVQQAVLQTSASAALHSAVVAEDSVELLGDPDEGGPATQLLQFAGPNVGAGGPDSAQDVPYCHLHRPFVKNFDCLPLRRSGISGDGVNIECYVNSAL